MFDRFNNDDQLASMRMTPEEITQLATLNIARIHEAAARHLGENTSVEASMAILNMTASLCFPASYDINSSEAIGMVSEILDLLPEG